MKNNNEILTKAAKYYSEKIIKYGNTPKGVDWNNQNSQELRFEQLLKIIPSHQNRFSINDIGCGYGALFKYLLNNHYSVDYYGFDISQDMLKNAQMLFKNYPNATFTSEQPLIKMSEYSISSGIFNVKMDVKKNDWENYISSMLDQINMVSQQGFSFNCLSIYSDKEYRRNDLYYGDCCYWFDYCKKRFSKNIALLHDYGLYEFTILVRKS